MIEFALLLPLLALILFGTVSYGTALYAYSSMQSVAEDTARRMAVGALTGSGTNTACPASSGAEQYACNNLPSWGTYSVTATGACPGSDTVTLTASASNLALGDVFGLLKSVSVTATAVQMREGTCS